MSDHGEVEIAELRQVNNQIRGSLERCRALLTECRAKLAANCNDAEADGGDELAPGHLPGPTE